MSNATPGPWKILGIAANTRHDQYQSIAVPNADGSGWQNIATIDPKNSEFNSYLIAAAPELLIELKEAVRRMQAVGWITKLAEKVISKAEGDEK